MNNSDFDRDDDVGTLIRDHASRYSAPRSLRDQVRATAMSEALTHELIGQAAGPRAQPSSAPPARARNRPWGPMLWAFLAGAAMVSALMVLLPPQVLTPAAVPVDEELVSDHVRSLMLDHLTDVASSDHHTVKPWFQGKLDFSPPVENFAPETFPLLGARLEYIRGRSAAALVYRHRAHVINVFVWPDSADRTTAATPSSEVTTRQGYHLLHWRAADMQWWLVSDLNADELRQFSDQLRRRVAPADTGP